MYQWDVESEGFSDRETEHTGEVSENITPRGAGGWCSSAGALRHGLLTSFVGVACSEDSR